ETEKVWDATDADGLPRVADKELANKVADAPSLMVAAFEPGKVCLAGEFLGRAWVGVATFDQAARKAAVKVIHEAKEAQDQTDKEQWRRTTVTFRPHFIATLIGAAELDGKPNRRVLVGRFYGENFVVYEHPLVIDPDRPSVEVLADRVWAWPSQDQIATDGKAVYFVEPMVYPEKHRHIVKIGFPGKAKEIVVKGLDNAETLNRIIVHDGRLHVALHQNETVAMDTGPNKILTKFRYKWWTVGLDGDNLRQVATHLPPIIALGVSSHYGLVAWIREDNQPTTLNVVEIPAPKPK